MNAFLVFLTLILVPQPDGSSLPVIGAIKFPFESMEICVAYLKHPALIEYSFGADMTVLRTGLRCVPRVEKDKPAEKLL